jgi:hypothetical protein
MSLMKDYNYPQLQFEAAWSLTNMATGTTFQSMWIIDKGGIPTFLNLMRSKIPQII